MLTGRVKIISNSSCRTSALLSYFCPLCLQNLYLEGNELTTLPDELFDKLPNLQWLDLRRNYLIRLPTVYTGRHQNLRNLLLEGNNLRTLPLELGESARLKNMSATVFKVHLVNVLDHTLLHKICSHMLLTIMFQPAQTH